MSEREQELLRAAKLFGSLSPERQTEVLGWVSLALKCPGFWAEFDALPKNGQSYEAVKALAERWKERAA